MTVRMEKRVSIPLLEGEKWWGGRVADGSRMPFGEQDFEADLQISLGGNQAAPLLLSNKGRYVWSEHPFSFTFKDGHLTIAGESAEFELGEGFAHLRGAYLQAARTYFPAAGSMPDPLLFTAPQYNLWIELLYDPTQDKVLEYARTLLAQGFPPGVLMIDDNWHEPYGTWKFHSGRFPDPAGMIEELHRLGFKVMLWVCPFVSPDSLQFRKLRADGLLLKDESGEVAIRKWWNGYSAVLDCTNDRAVRWLKEQFDFLQREYGVDGFKFDAGDTSFYQSSDRSFRKTDPHGHCEAWARIGLDYPLNEYRACWRLGGQPLAQRLRDKHHSWDHHGLGALIPDGLAQGLLGYAFTCPDLIGGGEYESFLSHSDKLDTEFFVRYAQCAALFPMMQFSAAPWRVLDQEHLAYCREAALLHHRMGEEMVALAEQSAKSGEPILRHLAYEFPDSGLEGVYDQFMLGEQILVAPVVVKGARSRRIAFPPGRWRGDDGSVVEGPCSVQVEAPLSRLPWYRLLEA